MDAAKNALAAKGNPTPALDARLLLQQAAGLGHETLIADPQRPVAPEAAARFREFLERRLAGEPVARILGEREFYGRAFRITPATLDPRPDTETLIEATLSFMPREDACRIIDLGTGSGIIGVTLLAERPEARAVMTDISADALAVAQDNARRHGVLARARFAEGSWFAGTEGPFDLVLSNPPYIPQAILQTLAPEVRNFDPESALVAGADGLQAYREIAKVAGPHLAPDGRVIVEIGEGQALDIEHIFKTSGFAPAGRWQDLARHVRCLGFSHA
ncbi:peptide chain release factor N(5)-glutamine methyltransferase [Taklimakanibacter deserti]|uniref:peptide chain release factor N(5)-glutamine methyltransferase n=1 Tax=Taklimakanibacter deserti TaxID=2267839 RepID=UPI0013C462E7